MKAYWDSLTKEQQGELAGKVGSTPGYLRLVFNGYKKASFVLAKKLEQCTSGAITKSDLRRISIRKINRTPSIFNHRTMRLTVGKYHWKVEKQPEWYVKAVRKTIAALPGGYAEAADWLDVTENALFNRLRADGDQIFPLGWAMVLQRAAGTHYIADAVAQSAGGVFVSLPEIEEVENADINQRLLEVIEQIGNYSKQIRSAIEDGVVEPHEQTAINDELYLSISKLQEHAALVYKIFCAPEKSDARECAAPGVVAFCVCGETNA